MILALGFSACCRGRQRRWQARFLPPLIHKSRRDFLNRRQAQPGYGRLSPVIGIFDFWITPALPRSAGTVSARMD